jgi:hypothetical protein
VRLLGYSLGFPGAVNINKFCLGSWVKLRFGFAQAIPRGSWLRKGMYGAEFCVFFSFVQALHFDSSKGNQLVSRYQDVVFLDLWIVIFYLLY